jgi:hypothetical protein
MSRRRPGGLSWAALVLLVVPAGVPVAAPNPWDWLGEAARQAKQEHNYGRAVSLLRGATALSGEHPDVLYALADCYELAGQLEEAADTYERFLARAPAGDPRRPTATAEMERLHQVVSRSLNPFVDAVFKPTPATAEAHRAFAEAERLVQKQRLPEAIVLFETAAYLDPDLPGPYRALGGLYGRVGQPKKKIEFLTHYLQIKPAGPIADLIRRDLRTSGTQLGRLSLQSTYPCGVEINGFALGRKTPLQGFELPEGRYVVTFDCSQPFHLERHARAEVQAGKQTTKDFKFGLIRPELSPWARVRVDGRDQGLWDTIALPEGRHHVELRAHDGSHEKELDVEVLSGRTVRIDKW